MTALRTLLTSLSAFILAGCSFPYSDQDRLDSMSLYEQMEISLPTNDQNEPVQRISPEEFMTSYSGLIISSDDIQELSPNIVAENQDDDSMLTLALNVAEYNPEVSKFDISFGGAAPVSEDGYFITAFHVIAKKSNWIVYLANENDNQAARMSKIRIVYANKQADFAVIKAEFPTPRFLHMRKPPLREDEPLFSGGWKNPIITAGNYVSSRIFSAKNTENGSVFYESIVTNPARYGDSGLPLIDSQGNVCGVISRTVLGRWAKKKKPKTYAILMNEDSLFEIINRDRQSN